MNINWATGVITVYTTDAAFMTDEGGNHYTMDTNLFRLAVLAEEDGEQGIVWPRVFEHNTQVLLGGVQYARVIEMLAPYTITFDDSGGQYAVTLSGSNNNFADKTNITSVSVRPTNSAGLIGVEGLLTTRQFIVLK